MIESITAEQSTGLLPDFIVKNAAGKFVPAPENFLEDVTDGTYSYNSNDIFRIAIGFRLNPAVQLVNNGLYGIICTLFGRVEQIHSQSCRLER